MPLLTRTVNVPWAGDPSGPSSIPVRIIIRTRVGRRGFTIDGELEPLGPLLIDTLQFEPSNLPLEVTDKLIRNDVEEMLKEADAKRRRAFHPNPLDEEAK